jgi:hypothetical protein
MRPRFPAPRKRRAVAGVGSRKRETPFMTKYEFSIRTRNGQRVDRINIQAQDRETAERRLKQMYMHCEVIECNERQSEVRQESLDVEGIINLITK